MGYFINTASSFDTIQRDIKELIPNPDMRRRMSRILKMGVSTAMDAIGQLPEPEKIGAIITATGMGCLTDSEKFLRNVIERNETLLNPTPFIQSTFNTAGAQIALLTGNHGYNMTYVHRGLSFESALLDAMIQIDENGAKNVVVTSFDESTPSLNRIIERMGLLRSHTIGEGAYAFIISEHPHKGCLAEIEDVIFPDMGTTKSSLLSQYDADTEFMVNDYSDGIYHTASAGLLWKTLNESTRKSRRIVIQNSYLGEDPALIVLKCI